MAGQGRLPGGGGDAPTEIKGEHGRELGERKGRAICREQEKGASKLGGARGLKGLPQFAADLMGAPEPGKDLGS